MQTGQTDQCANPACHCPAQMGSAYCGEYCELHSMDVDGECRCGHPECAIFGGERETEDAK